MKKDKMFHIMGLLDEDLINEAEEHKQSMFYGKWGRYGMVAASVIMCVIVGTGIYLQTNLKSNHNNNKYNFKVDYEVSKSGDEHNNKDLKKLSLSNSAVVDSKGGLGMLAYDINELKDGNPWTEAMNLTKLPVFKNKLIYNEFGKLMKLDIGTMEKRAYEVAEFLNIDTKKHKIEIHPNEAEVYLKSDKYEICVNSDMKTTVKFVKPFELPKDLRIKQDSEVTYEKLLKSSEYIKTKYKDIIPMENSKVKVIFGDYSYNREHISWSTCLYSDRDKDVDKIINYTFNNVDIVYDENGNFSDMIIYKPDLSDKLGDYPIITKKNAEELLCSGKYISMGEAKFPGKEYIRKTELVYRYGKEDHYMPYYRIYVEIPTEKQDNNLNCYEAFYVPAVEHSYIYDMDVWKGWYN